MKNFSPLEHHKQLARKISPSLRWDGSTPIEEWREKCREKFIELYGEW